MLTITAITLATLAGFSRAVVGAHWPMDIFAGAFGGWLAAVIGVLLYKRLAQHKNWGEQIPGQIIFNVGLLIIALSLLNYDNSYPGSQLFQIAIAVVSLIIITINFWHFFKIEKTAAQ